MTNPIDPAALIAAGRVPRELLPWKGRRGLNAKQEGDHAFLLHACMAGLHLIDDDGLGGYTVMDDSPAELARHFQALQHARGRVLKTGLGMGCFVRMALTLPAIEHIDVVEVDESIIDHFGAAFVGDPRVTIHHADALTWDFAPHGPWDFAWHDIYCEGNDGLQLLHAKLILRFALVCRRQGAWAMPRQVRRRAPGCLI